MIRGPHPYVRFGPRVYVRRSLFSYGLGGGGCFCTVLLFVMAAGAVVLGVLHV